LPRLLLFGEVHVTFYGITPESRSTRKEITLSRLECASRQKLLPNPKKESGMNKKSRSIMVAALAVVSLAWALGDSSFETAGIYRPSKYSGSAGNAYQLSMELGAGQAASEE
jgi:hypothetical protein